MLLAFAGPGKSYDLQMAAINLWKRFYCEYLKYSNGFYDNYYRVNKINVLCHPSFFYVSFDQNFEHKKFLKIVKLTIIVSYIFIGSKCTTRKNLVFIEGSLKGSFY